MILSADSSSLVSDAYARAQQAQAAADRKAGTMESITALEEKLTPYIKNIALAGVALVVTIAILRAGKKTRKNPYAPSWNRPRKKTVKYTVSLLDKKGKPEQQLNKVFDRKSDAVEYAENYGGNYEVVAESAKWFKVNPCGGPRMNIKGHDFKSFKDPWAVMSTEDRKKANRLFRSAMKTFSRSPKQKRFHDELMVILNKYNIGKGN